MIMWNPEQYHKFLDARMRPALDLIAQIPDGPYQSIIDLGCGSSEITHMLQQKYQPETIVGLDSSESMIQDAKKHYPTMHWQIGSIENTTGEFDLVFSNAALQWVKNHHDLFRKIASQAKKAVAIQVPNNFDMPSHVILREIIRENPVFYKKLASTLRDKPVLTPDVYFDILKERMAHINVWETTYVQPLTGDAPILEWVKGTALVPVKAGLSPHEYEELLAIYQAELAKAYPKRADGITLFPFSRLFMVANKA